jgi:DNA-binding NarL/FixJ family response regulator
MRSQRRGGRAPVIRILLVDDQRLFREGVRLILQQEPDIEVVGEGSTSEEAVRQTAALAPDVVLMNVSVPGDAIAAIETIRKHQRKSRILAFTTRVDPRLLRRAFEAGVHGFALKDILPGDLIIAIRAACNTGPDTNQDVVMPGLVERSMRRPKTLVSTAARRLGLTSREIDVLGALTNGLRNKEIADSLGISEATVQATLRAIYQRLRVHNRVQAVGIAVERELLGPNPVTEAVE